MSDNFADEAVYNRPRQEYKKTEYIQLAQGANIIRILQKKAKQQMVHYVNRGYVKCLGTTCPLCENNRNLVRDYPETFRKEKSYSPAIARYYVNVLDRTPAKVCVCGREHKDITLLKCQCDALLPIEIKPLNRVRVLAKGTSLFIEQLNLLQSAIIDPNTGERLPLTSFDINLFVKGEGRDTKITAIPDATHNDVVQVSEEELFDVEKLVIELEPHEMLEAQRGVSYKDIFAARRAVEANEAGVRQETVNESIGSLFAE